MIFSLGFFLGALCATFIIATAIYATVYALSYVSQTNQVPTPSELKKTFTGFIRPRTPKEIADVKSGKAAEDDAMRDTLAALTKKGLL
jgi:hypothetical protein